MGLTEYENFWNEISKVEEIDCDDEKVNRLLRFRAMRSHLSGVHTILDVGAADLRVNRRRNINALLALRFHIFRVPSYL